MRKKVLSMGILTGLVGIVSGCGLNGFLLGGSRNCENLVDQSGEIYHEERDEENNEISGREFVRPVVDEDGYSKWHISGRTEEVDVDFYDIGNLKKGEALSVKFGIEGIVGRNKRLKIAAVSNGNLEFIFELLQDFCGINNNNFDIPYDLKNVTIGIMTDSDNSLNYSLRLETGEGSGLQIPREQNIFLDFDCSEIASRNGENVEVTPSGFDEGNRLRISEGLENIFSDYKINFYSSREVLERLSDYSTVCFSGSTRVIDGNGIGGFARLDFWNDSRDDIAYILDLASEREQSFEQMISYRIATASHEIGHLLGLDHVSDESSVMNSGRDLSGDVVVGLFGNYRVDSSVFLGNDFEIYQDAPRMIGKLVGRSSSDVIENLPVYENVGNIGE